MASVSVILREKPNKDGSLPIAIQIIKNRKTSLIPIEAKGFDFCGNGYFSVKVHPGKFIMLLAIKYQGKEEDAMRIRLSIGETLYISRSYIGTYSAKQFNIDKASYMYRDLKDSQNPFRFDLFYGAIPREYNTH
jgi:hypothetical protein